jgi:hypothetical protein
MEFQYHDFRAELIKARDELANALRHQEEQETRIARLKRIIAGLAVYVDETEETDELLDLGKTSLKDSVRTALRALTRPATQLEVREVLKELHFPIDSHRNPSASVHTVLMRLVEAGEIQQGPEKNGKKTYVWVLPVYGAASSLANQMADRHRDVSRKRKK